jgi:hypothetical protein
MNKMTDCQLERGFVRDLVIECRAPRRVTLNLKAMMNRCIRKPIIDKVISNNLLFKNIYGKMILITCKL